MQLRLSINGKCHEVSCEPGDLLLAVLRREGLKSVRYGSGTGETGAAGVLLDGRLVPADVLLAAQAEGHEVTTVESLDRERGELHPIQAALVETGALQSGYSAGATVLAAKALIERDPRPSEDEIRDALSGVLDRESGYVKTVEAVRRAAAVMRGEKPEPFEAVLLSRLASGGPAETNANPTGSAVPAAVPRVVRVPGAPATSVVGRSERKVDSIRLAKGHPAFADDVELRGTLFAKVLRSPHAHARIVAIDDSRARVLPGVHAIVHHWNTVQVAHASGGQSWPNPHPWDQVSFDDKVRHVGDRVAAVAAETPELAEEACRLIDVTYDVLPAVLDPEEAIGPGAPVIHDEDFSVGIFDAARNVSHHIEGQTVSDAELEAAFAGSDRVFEQTFHVQQMQHVPIEPHATVGWLDDDDRLVLRTSNQVPFHTRRMVAPLLGLAVKDVRVVKPRIGGGFGSKQEMVLEDIVGHLVLACRRPVRLVLDREEEFVSSRTRHWQTLTFRTGVDRGGKLLAQDVRVVASTGAYGSHGFTVQALTGQRALSTYNCPAKRYVCDVAYTNRPVAGAFRGYGAPQAFFALESHLDDIAREIGIDPVELRSRNWVHTGDPLDIVPRLAERGSSEDVAPEDVPVVSSCDIAECMAQALRAVGWERRDDPAWKQPAGRPYVRRGIGFALVMQGSGIPLVNMSSASIKINDDGSFNLLTGAADIGTGADTVLAQIAAEVLGVGTDDILVYSGDTDLTPFDVGAYASSTTYIAGMAVKKAAEAARDQIRARAARLLQVADPASIELRDHRAATPEGKSVSLAAIALNALHTEEQEQIIGVASHVPDECPPPFAVQAAEVEVDVGTGQVTVTKLVNAVDCGVAINPVTASGQVEGGSIQALGYALTEEIVLDEGGRPLNAAIGPYWIFRADDTPPLESILVETVEASGPFGAKAVGEIPIDGVAPAVRNAIADATGVRLDSIPMTPEKVWRALSSRTLS